jgi:hypothetical protein
MSMSESSGIDNSAAKRAGTPLTGPAAGQGPASGASPGRPADPRADVRQAAELIKGALRRSADVAYRGSAAQVHNQVQTGANAFLTAASVYCEGATGSVPEVRDLLAGLSQLAHEMAAGRRLAAGLKL